MDIVKSKSGVHLTVMARSKIAPTPKRPSNLNTNHRRLSKLADRVITFSSDLGVEYE